jgi:hypothetical protein
VSPERLYSLFINFLLDLYAFSDVIEVCPELKLQETRIVYSLRLDDLRLGKRTWTAYRKGFELENQENSVV